MNLRTSRNTKRQFDEFKELMELEKNLYKFVKLGDKNGIQQETDKIDEFKKNRVEECLADNNCEKNAFMNFWNIMKDQFEIL